MLRLQAFLDSFEMVQVGTASFEYKEDYETYTLRLGVDGWHFQRTWYDWDKNEWFIYRRTFKRLREALDLDPSDVVYCEGEPAFDLGE